MVRGVGYGLRVKGYWLLVAGYWLLVAGYWLLVAGCGWLVAGGSWQVTHLRQSLGRQAGWNLNRYFLFFLFFAFGGTLHSQVFINDLEDDVYSDKWINVLIDSGNAHSGEQYSVADSMHPYGLGLESRFQTEMYGKNCWMYVDGWVKSNNAHDQAVFVTSIQKNRDVVYWKDVKLSTILKQAETWTYFSDSVLVPAELTKTGLIKAYLWNSDQQDTIAIDDLRFRFTPISNPSFLPAAVSFDLTDANPPNTLLFSNKYYQVLFNEVANNLSISGSSGQQLIKNIWYHDERRSDGVEETDNTPLSLKKVKGGKEATLLKFEVVRQGLKLHIEMHCNENSPEILFYVKEKYTPDQWVSRESLVIESSREVEEVFRANRKSDTKEFQKEYWLAKQGVRFGENEDSWFIYHQPGISSLQLDTESKHLWVNLDYKKDHPFLHFPLNNDTADLKEDWSESAYKKGSKRTFRFSIVAGQRIDHLPRLMKNPYGFLAAYIWAEHADFTDISTNRAAYYGSENIRHPDSAIGGFEKYSIPVTKSVFYANPDNITNTEISGGRFTGLESTIQSDTAFSAF